MTANTAAWLRRNGEDQFVAFAMNCTHLGCPVHWLQDAGLFMCPCHGGVYYSDGQVAAGPPPHALFKYPVRIRDGEVENPHQRRRRSDDPLMMKLLKEFIDAFEDRTGLIAFFDGLASIRCRPILVGGTCSAAPPWSPS